MDPNEKLHQAGETPINQGHFLEQFDSNLQQRLYESHQQVYIHKVKAASILDLSKTSRDAAISYNQNYGMHAHAQMPPNQIHSSDSQMRERLSFHQSQSHSGERELMQGGEYFRESVILPGTTPPVESGESGAIDRDKMHYEVRPENPVNYSGVPSYDSRFSNIDDGRGRGSTPGESYSTESQPFDGMQRNISEEHNQQMFINSRVTASREENIDKNTDSPLSQSYGTAQPSVEGLPNEPRDLTNYQVAATNEASTPTASYTVNESRQNSNSLEGGTCPGGVAISPLPATEVPEQTPSSDEVATNEASTPTASYTVNESRQNSNSLEGGTCPRGELIAISPLPATEVPEQTPSSDEVIQEQVHNVPEKEATDEQESSSDSATDDDTSSEASQSSYGAENPPEIQEEHSALQEKQADVDYMEQDHIPKVPVNKAEQPEDIPEEEQQPSEITTKQEKSSEADQGVTDPKICVKDTKESASREDPTDFVTVSWYHFKCKFCFKTFQDCKKWKKHLVNEHGVKPYVCMYCDERFERKSMLKEHHRLHETGGVPDKVVQKTEKIKAPASAKPKPKPAPKPKQPRLKLTIQVPEERRGRRRGRVPAKKPTTRGRKKKTISKPLKKQRDPEILRKACTRSSRAEIKDDDSGTGSVGDDSGRRNKRKRGPVFRYIPESYEPVKRKRQAAKTVPCSHCTRTFTSNQARLLHEKSHRTYECNKCGDNFRLKRELKLHEATHDIPKKRKNPLKKVKVKVVTEEKDSEDDDDDDNEKDNVEDNEEDKSDEDNKSDTNYELSDTDVDDGEGDDGERDDGEGEGEDSEKDEGGPYKCQFCPRMIKKRRNVAKHEKTHVNGAPHTCPHCQKVYVRRRDLRRHMVRHTTDKPYQCQKCKKRFKHDIGLRRHMRLHTGEGLLVCQFCGKKYNGKGSLKAHERIHTGKQRLLLDSHVVPTGSTEKPYQCGKCKKRFKHEIGLQRHMRLHSGEGLLVCQYCGKKYNGKGSLKAHERIHTGEKPYKCHYCDKWFGTQTAQKYHELEHTGGMICHVCGRQFKSKHNLQEHERIHSGERPYKCGRCDQSFMSVGARRYHMNVHTGDEHWCDICNKQFTCKASLDAHKFTHTGLHPYACKFCPKHFNSISGVRGHEKQVHLGLKRKHKTKAQKVLEKALIVQKKAQVDRTLTKKELKAISDAAKAATMSEQTGALKPGRKPRDKQLPKNIDPNAFINAAKSTKLTQNPDFTVKISKQDAPILDYNNRPTSGPSQKLTNVEKQYSKTFQGIHDVEYPTRVVIGDPDCPASSGTAGPVDYTATYVSSALQKAIGLIPRGHNNQPHPHASPWPTQHVANSHLDTMVESLVQFSKF